MKSLFMQLFLLLTAIAAFGQQDSITLTGTLKGQGNAKLYVTYTDADGKREYKPATAKDDVFSLKIKKQTVPCVARLATALERSLSKKSNGINYGNPAPDLNFFLYQSNLTINGTAGDIFIASVKGDPENDGLEKYRILTRETSRQQWELQKKMFYMGPKDSLELKKLATLSGQLFDRKSKADKGFVKANPNSLASLYLLSMMENYFTTTDYEAAFNGLSSQYKNTLMAQNISKRIGLLSVTAKGAQAKDFARTTSEGQAFKLKDLQGKVVLLDFWGSWCGPCRASMPHLKQLYSKYKGKGFEIVGIAAERGKTLDESTVAWQKAIKEEGLQWINVLNNEAAAQMNIVGEYRVNAFPTKILLDEDGKVLLRITASATDDIDVQLKKIYGE